MQKNINLIKEATKMIKKIIIMGAAGRDFHDFLVFFKNNLEYEVVCFTAEQIPGIVNRKFPRELAGSRYPKGIPIFPEKDLPSLIKKFRVDEVILSYSDLNFMTVMQKASLVLASGANFRLLSYKQTSLKSKKPVISVCAVRTGCGKSQVSRKIALILRKAGKKVVCVRHPMPYGDLVKQRVQRFATYEDMKNADCTIEEREEYEPHVRNGIIVYAGVDYEEILRHAENEADIIIWDGGNNDVPFYKSDLHIVVVDPFRAGHEAAYHPGMENFLLSDVIIINKMDSAPKSGVEVIEANIKKLEKESGKKRIVIRSDSELTSDNPELVKGKNVLVVEDGPTLTHGGMAIGAGEVYAKGLGAKIVDPRKYAVGSIKEVYKKFAQLSDVIPAMGYSKKQMKELEKTINRVPCDAVVDGSPFDLGKLLKVNKKIVNVKYDLAERGHPDLKDVLKKFMR